MDQRPRRAGAHLALVEGVEHQTLDRLVQELVVVVHHVGEEDVGRLAAQLDGRGDEVLGRVLHDQPTGRGLAGEADLGDARARGQGLADLAPGPVTMLITPGGTTSSNDLGQLEDRPRGGGGRLDHGAVARSQGGSDLPGGHQ